MNLKDYFPRPFHFHPRNWSIGRKIVFLGVVTSFISFGAILLALSVVITEYAKVRDESIHDYQRRVDTAVEMTTSARRVFAEDYANWDEMYHAIEKGDTEWFMNATTGSLKTFEADAYWIYRSDGKLMHSESLPGKELNVQFSSALISTFSRTDTIIFFQNIQGRIVHLTVAPINDPTDTYLPSNGFMIVAKEWDTARLKDIGDIVGAQTRYVIDQKPHPEIDTHVHIFEHLSGVDATSVATIEFTFEDRSLQLIRNSLYMMLGISTILGGGLIYFSHKQQYHWLVEPISNLIVQMRAEQGASSSVGSMLTSKDEIEILKLVVADHIEKLRQNQRLSLTVEASTNGIAITDLNGSINYVNDAWKKLNGYTLEEAKGNNPRLLQSGKTPPETYTKMWAALTSGKSFTTESIINRRKDGSEYDCRLSVYPIKEAEKTVGYVGIQQDISHRKEVDRMKTEFISMASHQLRTPLSAMRWFGELLLEKKAGDLNEKQQELVQNFYDSTLRMISLVNALLNISRLESGRMIVEPRPTELPELVDTVVMELSGRISAKKIEFIKKIDQTLPAINVDPQLVREVYSNLITNAVKYTSEGGKITLTINHTPTDILSSITDTGVGIPESEQSKVFSKFFRAKNVTSLETDGTGLGLYLVQTIILSSKGKLGFESVEGKGSTFWFSLPKSGMEAKSGSVRIGN